MVVLGAVLCADAGQGFYDDFFVPRYVQLALTTAGESAAVVDIPMAPLDAGQRISAAVAVEPKKMGASRAVGIYVKLRIAPGHYVYGLEKLGKSSTPTSFEVKLPEGFSLESEWRGPKTERLSDGSKVYKGDVVFWNRLAAKSGVRAGQVRIPIKVSFQVCNEALCWPAEEIARELELEIVETGTEGK